MIKGNKKVTALLLVAVLSIYSIIWYKSYFVNDPSNQISLSSNEPSTIISNYLKDTFIVDNYLSDPFRVNQRLMKQKPDNSSTNQSVKTKKEPIKPKSNPKWPNLSYYGFIKNLNSSHQRCLLSINGQVIKVKMSESNNGVIVRYIYIDSIQVEFNSEFKTIFKSN